MARSFGLAAAIGLAALSIQPVSAQSREASGTRTAQSQALPGSRGDDVAKHMLNIAMREIQNGKRDVAQRLLEQLVARYPDSVSAVQARARLHALYAVGGSGSIENGLSKVRTPPMGLAGPTNKSDSRPIGGWRTSVADLSALREDFINGTGDRVFFSAGSAKLGSRSRTVLERQAKWLIGRPQTVAVVEGHADDADVGSDDVQLAKARAAIVRERLIAEGLDPARIKVRSFGSSKPVAVCEGSDCAAQNRRVVVLVDLAEQPRGFAVEREGKATFDPVQR